jgi:serine/threonine protein kinase/Tol biopolymer transport system component
MSLALGTKLGCYEIRSQLGAGGMGEVYRARDEKLNRDVAIKVLPEAFAQDEERIGRFKREAQVLASLNHPNIAAIYGLEESDAIRALVMELVEGPTLADRIAAGPIPLDEALGIARQIADALEVAHERGVIHRDLKPANVKVTPDGIVKVLDFGLAKIVSNETPGHDLSRSPTMPLGTQAGVILGTAAYMSPEQAKGKIVDKRADIWAFGALLFEMLSARRCFGGETLTDTLAAVVRAEPNWEDLPADTPPSIVRLLRHCLAKDPKLRLRDTGDARFELEMPGEPKDARVGLAAAATRGWRTPLTLGLLVLAALTGGVLLSRLWYPRTSSPSRVIRLIHTIPSGQTPSGQSRRRLAISPAGDKLVYVANNRLYLRPLNALDAVELTGTDAATSPFFSPDGEWVGFLARGQLTKAPVNGGPPVLICKIADADGAYWGPDNTILIGGVFEGILRVSADGGNAVVLVSPSPSLTYTNPQFLPDGHSFLFHRGQPGDFDQSELVMRSVDKDDETVVFHGGYEYQYVKPGYLLVSQGARNQPLDLSMVSFDATARKVVGNPTTVVRNLGYASLVSSSNFAVSDLGTLIYFPATHVEGSGTRLAAVDRSGKASVLPSEARDYSDPRVSPDGRFVAAHLQGNQNDIWVADVTRGALTRLSHDLGEDETPAWSPDGRTVAWAASRSDLVRGVFRRPADGSGAEELIWRLDNHCHVRDWSPDGRTLVIEIQEVNSSTDIWRLNLEGTPTATVFLQTRFNERNSRLSPEGRWLAYVSDESGRDEVYIQAFPKGGSKLQISSTGGDEPVWSRHGRKLYFRGGGSIQETGFHADAQPSVDATVALFPDTFESPQGGGHTGYDVFPDGRFLMIQFRSPGAHEEIVVVVNWIEELKGQLVSMLR